MMTKPLCRCLVFVSALLAQAWHVAGQTPVPTFEHLLHDMQREMQQDVTYYKRCIQGDHTACTALEERARASQGLQQVDPPPPPSTAGTVPGSQHLATTYAREAEAQYNAAQKALQQGDTATARRLLERAKEAGQYALYYKRLGTKR